MRAGVAARSPACTAPCRRDARRSVADPGNRRSTLLPRALRRAGTPCLPPSRENAAIERQARARPAKSRIRKLISGSLGGAPGAFWRKGPCARLHRGEHARLRAAGRRRALAPPRRRRPARATPDRADHDLPARGGPLRYTGFRRQPALRTRTFCQRRVPLLHRGRIAVHPPRFKGSRRARLCHRARLFCTAVPGGVSACPGTAPTRREDETQAPARRMPL